MTSRVAVLPVGEVLPAVVVAVQAGVLSLMARSPVLLSPAGLKPVVMSRMTLSAAM